MPYRWSSHADDCGITSDIDSSLECFPLEGETLLTDIIFDANVDYDEDEDLEVQLHRAAVESSSRQPMCSTPDAKRRKLDVAKELKPLESTRVKRPMNAFMLWSQVSLSTQLVNRNLESYHAYCIIVSDDIR